MPRYLYFFFPSGYYAYVHSGVGSFFDVAKLQSRNMSKTGAGCTVSFYYHMYSTSVAGLTGILSLKLQYKGSTSDLFEVSSNKGDKWMRQEVGLGALDKGIVISVHGMVWSPYVRATLYQNTRAAHRTTVQ